MSTAKLAFVTVFCLLLSGIALIASTVTVTEDSERIYGQGVHAFFDRDYEGAVTILLKIDDIKSADPRPYYFLGLAYLRQEKTEQADQYFKKAAQLEYSGRAARDYGVAESLRRIQGEERLRIEKIRSEERTNAQIREQQFREARYGKENADDRESLRQIAPQHQKEDLAVLQKMAGNFGGNAFGVKPIDPINTTEESVVIHRRETNPLGEVTTTVSEATTISVSPDPIISTPTTPSRTERQFVNPDVPVAVRTQTQSGATLSPVRSAQAAAAKEFGKGLGAWVSRLGSAE